MNYQELNELIEKRKEEIIEKCYTFTLYHQVTLIWKELLIFIKDNNLYYNDATKEMFLNNIKNKYKENKYKYAIMATNIIDNIDNVIKKSSFIIDNCKELDLTNYNNDILTKYLKYNKEEVYNSDVTLKDKKYTVIEIMKYFQNKNILEYRNLKTDNINEFINSYLYNESYYSKKRYSWVLKDFLKYLYYNEYTDRDYTCLIPKIKNKNCAIHSFWTEEEIEKIVNNLQSNTSIEKRNKAIVLLAIRLGIREIDIINLKFENIDWKKNTITFEQHKTKVNISLPLTEEVGIAIIDYINNGRPKSKEKDIFVTHNEYCCKLSNNFNLNQYLTDTYKLSNLDYESKNKKGIHTFRHSIASNMLKSGIPLDIISSSLGHVNKESTKTYLNIDNDKLLDCCLEVPNE